MADAPGWKPDPERDDRERYWSGSAWTDRVRPAGKAGSLHVPEHVPHLHRALSAATADIDAVEDQLSVLFERTDGPSARGASASTAASADTDEDGAFAGLDAALAAEEPDEPEPARRKLFRRRR